MMLLFLPYQTHLYLKMSRILRQKKKRPRLCPPRLQNFRVRLDLYLRFDEKATDIGR